MKQLLFLVTLGITLTSCAMDNAVDNGARVQQAVNNLVSEMRHTVQPHYDEFMQHEKTTQAVDKLESGLKWLTAAEKDRQAVTKTIAAVTALVVVWYAWGFVFGGTVSQDPYAAALMPISSQHFVEARDNGSEKTVTINVYAAPANA